MKFNQYLDYSDEALDAIKNNKPIVAMESALISHGLPFPHNIETTVAMENIIRDEGATPATIAVMKGKIKIGLNKEELDLLATHPDVLKISRRDLAYALSQADYAATTVAGTMFCAHLAGIRFFATGGIGGVHRNWQRQYDVSADLLELGLTPVVVICSGAKSILEIPTTLEYLESMSVPIIGFNTKTFPMFYTSASKYKLANTVSQIIQLSDIIQTHYALSMPSGILVANPVPKNASLSLSFIEPLIQKAIKLAEERHITGKAITPFLLKEITAQSSGKCLQTNIALLINNAKLAAKIAAETNQSFSMHNNLH